MYMFEYIVKNWVSQYMKHNAKTVQYSHRSILSHKFLTGPDRSTGRLRHANKKVKKKQKARKLKRIDTMPDMID